MQPVQTIGLAIASLGLIVLFRHYLPDSIRDSVDEMLSIQRSDAEAAYAADEE